MGKEVGNDQVDECFCLLLSPSQRCPDVSWWPVPSLPHFRSPSIFQNPLAVWSPCREPAPREFSTRQRRHLPLVSVCFKCHLPCLLMSQQGRVSIAWLEMSPGSMCLGRSQEMSWWSDQWTGILASPPPHFCLWFTKKGLWALSDTSYSKQTANSVPASFSQQLRDWPSHSPAY